jgi:hypothetical protein
MSARPEVFAAHDIELLSIADVLTPREPFAFDRESFVWTRGPSRLATSHRAAMREIARLRAEVSRLRRENAALQQDRERLDWLERNGDKIGPAWRMDGTYDGWSVGRKIAFGATLREAIDAARVAAPREREEPK